jgi:hypothetical protein
VAATAKLMMENHKILRIFIVTNYFISEYRKYVNYTWLRGKFYKDQFIRFVTYKTPITVDARRSTVARLLRSWVRIPPGARMFVCCVCCQLEVSATSWSLVQESPTDCGASLCVIRKPRELGGHSPRWAAEPEKIIISNPKCLPKTFSSDVHVHNYGNFVPYIAAAYPGIFSGWGVFNKFSWGQKAERMGIWGR